MDSQRPGGRIFRVKHGYNPNSSSVGSLVFALPVSLMALSGGFVVVSGLIFSAFLKNDTPDACPDRPEKGGDPLCCPDHEKKGEGA